MPERIDIRKWEDLIGLESKHYKLTVDLSVPEAWIVPKIESETTLTDYWLHHKYIGVFLFDINPIKNYEELLRSYGFNVNLIIGDFAH